MSVMYVVFRKFLLGSFLLAFFAGSLCAEENESARKPNDPFQFYLQLEFGSRNRPSLREIFPDEKTWGPAKKRMEAIFLGEVPPPAKPQDSPPPKRPDSVRSEPPVLPPPPPESETSDSASDESPLEKQTRELEKAIRASGPAPKSESAFDSAFKEMLRSAPMNRPRVSPSHSGEKRGGLSIPDQDLPPQPRPQSEQYSPSRIYYPPNSPVKFKSINSDGRTKETKPSPEVAEAVERAKKNLDELNKQNAEKQAADEKKKLEAKKKAEEEARRKAEEKKRQKEQEARESSEPCWNPEVQRAALFAFLIWDYPGYRNLSSEEQRQLAYGRLRSELQENFPEAMGETQKKWEKSEKYQAFGKEFLQHIDEVIHIKPDTEAPGFFYAFQEACRASGKSDAFPQLMSILLATENNEVNRQIILRKILGESAPPPGEEGIPHGAEDGIMDLLKQLGPGERHLAPRRQIQSLTPIPAGLFLVAEWMSAVSDLKIQDSVRRR